MPSKSCNICQEQKSLEDYYSYKEGKPYAACKKCHIGRTETRRQADPTKWREASWRRRGIQLKHADYEDMHRLQDGKCLICKKPEVVSGRLLAVDHDHETGVIRGLLCYRCNTNLGWYEENASSIQDYLKE